MNTPSLPPLVIDIRPVSIPPDELQRWGRLLHMAAAADFAIVMTNHAGQVQWVPEGQEKVHKQQVQFPPCEAAASITTPSGDAWLIHALPVSDGDIVIHAMATHGGVSAPRLDQMRQALDDTCTSLRERAHILRDLDMGTRELSDRYEELHLIYDIDNLIAHQRPQVDIFPDLLDICAKQLRVDTCSFVDASTLRVITAKNLVRPINDWDLVEGEMRGNLFRFVQGTQDSITLNGYDDERKRFVFANMPYKLLATPVIINKKMEGLLVMLRHPERTVFSNSDHSMALVMANQIAGMLQTRRLIGELSRFSEQLAACLTEVMESKDPYTRGHSERVQAITVAIAKEMGLTPEQCEYISWAALLHDLGKIGVPDAILTKPSRLTDEEFAYIKMHPGRSYAILAHVDHFPEEAKLGAKHHHERWDGQGYPDRLESFDIPLFARIISVADMYDAITSSRAYRPGSSHDKAMAEIVRVSGTQLDPTIVKIFQALCQDHPERFPLPLTPA